MNTSALSKLDFARLETASAAGEKKAPPCRPGCGACCTAPSISSPIPGSPPGRGIGKPAGARCAQLTPDGFCALFGLPERPAVCVSLRPSFEMCGETREHAVAWITALERDTAP